MRSSAGLGATTLIMIFSVLCLTVFAVLSLSSARAELKLAERYASSVENYYAADTEASRQFAELIDSTSADGEISYTVAVDGTMNIEVTVTRQDGVWRVLSWELSEAALWSPDDNMSVWGGN